jgi:hypothetical protein
MDNPYTDPVTPKVTWNLNTLKEWLSRRKLKVAKPHGQTRAKKADYVKTIIDTGWQGPGDLPLVAQNPTTAMPGHVFEDAIVSCHTMVARIMSVTDLPTDEDKFEIDRSVKLYLSFDDEFLRFKFHSANRRQPEGGFPIRTAPNDFRVQIDVDEESALRSRATLLQHSPTPESDDEGSMSDDSGVGLQAEEANLCPGVLDDDLAHCSHSSSKAAGIPAMLKRNKINLLKIVQTLTDYGPYHLLSELGPKGEGAIQTMKPIVKNQGASIREGSFLQVASKWSTLRFAKCVIGMTISSFTEATSDCDSQLDADSSDFTLMKACADMFSQYVYPVHNPDEQDAGWRVGADGAGTLPLNQVTWSDTYTDTAPGNSSCSKKMYVVHGRRSDICDALCGGGPVSFAVFEHKSRKVKQLCFGCAYKHTDGSISLAKILPTQFIATRFGASSHKWELAPMSNSSQDCIRGQALVVDYGVLLPARASIQQAHIGVFHAITYRWKEVLENGVLGFYRQKGCSN